MFTQTKRWAVVGIGSLVFACAVAAGCQQPRDASLAQDVAPDPEIMRLYANGDRIKAKVKRGAIHAGQDLQTAMKDCVPFHVVESPPYTFIEAYMVPGFSGLTLTAVNGKLVTAYEWSCTYSIKHFNTLSERETETAEAVYEKVIVDRIAAQTAAIEASIPPAVDSPSGR